MKNLLVVLILHLWNLNIINLIRKDYLCSIKIPKKGHTGQGGNPQRVLAGGGEPQIIREKQILIIIKLIRQTTMRVGHRRTQSSNLGFEAREDIQPFQNYSHAHRKSEVCRLLDQSQAKIKEKIYSVDTLSTEPKEEKSGLFNFGKGLLSHQQPKQKQKNMGPLVAIPEKPKLNSAKCKRTPETEVESMKKQKIRRKSIVKISFKEKDKIAIPPHEEMNRIMKIKIGIIEEKTKKYSAYFSEKPVLRNIKLKKQISQAK